MEGQWIEGEEVLESSKVSLNLVSKEVQVLKAGGLLARMVWQNVVAQVRVCPLACKKVQT